MSQGNDQKPLTDPLLEQPVDRLVEIIYHKNERIAEMRQTIEKQELAQGDSVSDKNQKEK